MPDDDAYLYYYSNAEAYYANKPLTEEQEAQLADLMSIEESDSDLALWDILMQREMVVKRTRYLSVISEESISNGGSSIAGSISEDGIATEEDIKNVQVVEVWASVADRDPIAYPILDQMSCIHGTVCIFEHYTIYDV